jgi:hypothetical protein
MNLRPYMQEVSRLADKLGMMIILWRRQSGKTTWLGWRCLKIMLQVRGALCTLVSASLNVGSELTEKEAMVFRLIIDDMRRDVEKAGLMMTTNIDKLAWDDYLEMLDKSRLEVRLWHDKTSYSRTKIIAPNVATARGYSGWVFPDEFGFIKDFKAIFEAIEPIASSDPNFRICMATTPPDDDSHYSYELTVPPEGTVFAPNPRGNWYTSTAGIRVHRVDAWDAAAANVSLYDTQTRQPLTPEQHRAKALDRDAWDRNYGLKFVSGGTCACSLMSLQRAQELGAAIQSVVVEDDLPSGWDAAIVPGLPTVIAQDPATTEKEKSNPTALVVAQRHPLFTAFPLVIRYRTADDRRQKALLREVVDGVRARKASLRRIGIDATNERYYAQQIKREFQQFCPVDLIVGSETARETEHEDAARRMNNKTYTGNLLVNELDDGRIALPPSRWLRDDWRLVIRSKGGFDNQVDSAGNHGDTFDGAKAAVYLLSKRGGPGECIPVVAEFLEEKRKRRNFWRPDHSRDERPSQEETVNL